MITNLDNTLESSNHKRRGIWVKTLTWWSIKKEGLYSCLSLLFMLEIKHAESSEHIFLHCPVTNLIWIWLTKGIQQPLGLSSCNNLLFICQNVSSSQVRQIMIFVKLHIVWLIWIERNKRRFSKDHMQSGPS